MVHKHLDVFICGCWMSNIAVQFAPPTDGLSWFLSILAWNWNLHYCRSHFEQLRMEISAYLSSTQGFLIPGIERHRLFSWSSKLLQSTIQCSIACVVTKFSSPIILLFGSHFLYYKETFSSKTGISVLYSYSRL